MLYILDYYTTPRLVYVVLHYYDDSLRILAVLAIVSAQSEQCSQPLGNGDQTEYTRTNDDLFLLDVDHPAQCDGTVDSLSYCVYRPSMRSNNPNHQAFVALFRPNSSNVNLYTRVSPFTTLSQPDDDIGNNGFFGCFTCEISEDISPLLVQAGDVLGVCQIEPGGITRILNVVGTAAPNSSPLYAISANDDCMTSEISSTVRLQDLTRMENYALQVYANIGEEIWVLKLVM